MSGAKRTPSESGYTHEDYEVGWICALPEELAASRAMLDECHQSLPPSLSDPNCYHLGRIGDHNVVIAGFPAGVVGLVPAANVAIRMLASFKSIRFGLMVGIGGGVPSDEQDIRLGDVVVSRPTLTSGGVVQYDHGKAMEEGVFLRTGSLNAPPEILLNAVGSLQSEHMLHDDKLQEYVEDMVQRYPRMNDFMHPGEEHDRLFEADYIHVSGARTCERCRNSNVIERPQRSSTRPLIHYGIVASGSAVMKSAARRDQISRELKVSCFEMEAAGLMNNFPCLVIRGICDYADSHKNDRWQRYAAATAAAYAKELLGIIAASRLHSTPTALQALGFSTDPYPSTAAAVADVMRSS